MSVPKTTPYSEAINAYTSKGVIEGYIDSETLQRVFRPKATLNRAEFTKIVLEARSDDEEFSGENCFPDVQEQWHAKYICTAKDEGIIQGYPDGTFKPNQKISFVEAGKIITLAFKQDVQNQGSEWYEKYALALEASKAIPPTIDTLEKNITRDEMVEMMWRLTEAKTDQPSKGYLNVKYPEISIDLSSG